jgi:hypothetical protein
MKLLIVKGDSLSLFNVKMCLICENDHREVRMKVSRFTHGK